MGNIGGYSRTVVERWCVVRRNGTRCKVLGGYAIPIKVGTYRRIRGNWASWQLAEHWKKGGTPRFIKPRVWAPSYKPSSQGMMKGINRYK